MTTDPDFEALRAQRNERLLKRLQEVADQTGVPLQDLRHTANFDACYCACSTGGPCEHKWDGEPWLSKDGTGWSTTCSRCGMTAMSHDMRFLP